MLETSENSISECAACTVSRGDMDRGMRLGISFNDWRYKFGDNRCDRLVDAFNYACGHQP